MRYLGVLVAVAAVVVASCAVPTRESMPETTFPTPASGDLEQTPDDARLLTAWLSSEERALAHGRWQTNVETAMKDYLINGYNTGQIQSGDCPIGRSGIAISCDMMDSYTSETDKASDMGLCADYLRDFGCRALEYYTDHVRERWYQQNG